MFVFKEIKEKNKVTTVEKLEEKERKEEKVLSLGKIAEKEEKVLSLFSASFLETIGTFSAYKGINGEPINEGLKQSILVKQMLMQLFPEVGWMGSDLTKLEIPLDQQADEDIITISSKVNLPINEDIFDSNPIVQGVAQSIIKKQPQIPRLELQNQVIDTLKKLQFPFELFTKEKYESVFGNAECKISKKELKRLAKTAIIVTNSDFVTPELFIKIQTELNDINLDKIRCLHQQEIRNLNEIIIGNIYGNIEGNVDQIFDGSDDDQVEQWNCVSLGYENEERLNKILNINLLTLSSNICHAQEVHFFVEQHKSAEGLALNKLRNTMLDYEIPNVLLTIPWIKLNSKFLNIANLMLDEIQIVRNVNDINNQEYIEQKEYYNVIDLKLKHKNEKQDIFISVKELAIGMWKTVLSAALVMNAKNIGIMALSLEALIDYDNDRLRQIMTKIYFENLLEILGNSEYSSNIDNILINSITATHVTQAALNQVLCKNKDLINKIKENGCNIQMVICDIKMLAIEYSKKQLQEGNKQGRFAIVSPSNVDVVLGIKDIGQRYKYSMNYSIEEDMSATSTGCIGSRGMQATQDLEGNVKHLLYTNINKVLSTKNINNQLKLKNQAISVEKPLSSDSSINSYKLRLTL